MFAFAILIGIFSYIIFGLGISNLLYSEALFLSVAFFASAFFYIYRKKLSDLISMSLHVLRSQKKLRKRKILNFKKIEILLISLLCIHVMINFIGALGPELAFDALWYHLTIPKIFLENNSIFYIPGNLLYYSLMPKLGEMLYIFALFSGGEVFAKIIHFSFGILTLIVIYKISKELFSKKISLLVCLIFYSNLVVGWQSITAYIDLIRTFFELMALWGFLLFIKNGEKKWLIESSVMMGLAISSKLLSIASLIIMFFLIIVYSVSKKKEFNKIIRLLIIYSSITLLIPMPWFVFSFLNTGNPFYPFFTDLYEVGFNISLINPYVFIKDFWIVFTQASDPISPLYLIFIPLIVIYFKKFDSRVKYILGYSIISFLIWYVTPRTGGGRFLLPYLPAFSIVLGAVISEVKDKRLYTFMIGAIIFVFVISVLYRGAANFKYISVLTGQQTKSEFLTKNLNFDYGDFYDTDGFLGKNIKKDDLVLTIGFHNLYYINFPFVDYSFVKEGDEFNYIAVQDGVLPEKFKDWELVYYNPKTNVGLYSKGGIKWVY